MPSSGHTAPPGRATPPELSAQGLRSDPLRAALLDALRGRTAALETLLARSGGLPGPRPNLKLAAAFGAEVATLPAGVAPLLLRLGDEEGPADSARAFLPIAAAHGWVGRLRVGRDVETAWASLAELAADHRAPVRAGTLDALTLVCRREGGPDTLVARAGDWLGAEDRELRWGAAGLVVEVLGDPRVLAAVRVRAGLTDYLSRVLGELAGAPRAADRSETRRRALQALPRTLSALVSALPEDGGRWLAAECAQAFHPQLREALSGAIVRLSHAREGHGSAVTLTLRRALEGSAKPPRDPTRIRPGAGRGKATRRVR